MMMDIDPIADKLKLSITRFCTALCRNRFWKLSAGKLAACAALAVLVVFSCAALIVSGIDSRVTAEDEESDKINVSAALPEEEAAAEEEETGVVGYWRKADISEYNRPLQAIAVEKEEEDSEESEAETSEAEPEAAESTAEAETVEEAPAADETQVVTDDGLPVNVEAEDDGLDEVLEDDEDDANDEFESKTMTALAVINLRSAPDDESYVMDIIPAYSQVDVSEVCEDGKWYTVNYNGMDGYVRVEELSSAE